MSRITLAACALALALPPAASAAQGAAEDPAHAAAREAAQRKLAAFPATEALQNHWEAQRLINGVADYGAANRASGPVIAGYLDKRFDEDLRASAALALGAIADRSAIPALLALAPELGDDWLLAYNAAESLGRLHAAEARPLLERLARDHWHRGVRHNASRALAMLDGGAFARPGVPEDAAPSERQDVFALFALTRHDADVAPQSCAVPDRTRSTDTHGRIAWSGPAAAAFASAALPQRFAGRFSASDSRRMPQDLGQGGVVAVEPEAWGHLVALNGGEFGGGLAYLPKSGPAFTLVREPVGAMWRMGGRIYVAAGLSHLLLDYGHLYVIDPAGPRVERTIRLPASPIRLTALSERLVVVTTEAGDLAVRDDGTLVDAAVAGDCPE